MKLSKYGHSCVGVEFQAVGAHHRLVIDPGTLSDLGAALPGAEAILVTHGHADHLDPDAVLGYLEQHPEVRLYGPADVVAALEAHPAGAAAASRLVTVAPGESLDVLGLSVAAVGGQHALIHPLLRTIDNVGYVLDGAVYHPGDALIVPEGPASLEVLLVPAWAPWSKTSEVVDFVAAVRAKRAYSIHDAPLKEAGRKIIGAQLAGLGGRTGSVYEVWEDGTSIQL